MQILNLWIALGLLALGFLLGVAVDTLRWRRRYRAARKQFKMLKRVNSVLMD